MKKKRRINHIFIFLLIALVLNIGIANAESNGLWTHAKDVRSGTFGSDEGFDKFSFNSSVDFNSPVNMNSDLNFNAGSEVVMSGLTVDNLKINDGVESLLLNKELNDHTFVRFNHQDGASAYIGFANANDKNFVIANDVDGSIIDLLGFVNIRNLLTLENGLLLDSSNINMNNNYITNLANPTNDKDAANKIYVNTKISDSALLDLDKDSTNEIQNIITNQGLIIDGSNNFGLINTCAEGQVLKRIGTSWVCRDDDNTEVPDTNAETICTGTNVLNGNGQCVSLPVDTNTWNQNTKTVAGYVTAPGAVAYKVWKTDANGNPSWDIDWDSQLTEAQVDAYTNNNGYLTSESDPQVGTLTSGKWCRNDGSKIICDVNTVVDTTIPDTNTWNANTKTSNGYVTAGSGESERVWKTDVNGNPGWDWDAYRTDASIKSIISTVGYLTSESDPQVGTLTSGKYCTTDGTKINCQSTIPADGDGDSNNEKPLAGTGITVSDRTVNVNTGVIATKSSVDTLTARVDALCDVGGTGWILKQGQTKTLFKTKTVPFGSSCLSASRTCQGPDLDGDSLYTYPHCEVDSPSDCSLDGKTVEHGTSGTFYTTNFAPECSNVDQSRLCTNGVLGGSSSYDESSCTTTNCYVGGVTMSTGETRDFYQSIDATNCASIKESRFCKNGVATGSYTYATCTNTCFAGGEEVLTLNGEIAIKDIKVGDIVVSFDDEVKEFTTSVVGEIIVHDGIQNPINNYGKDNLLELIIQTNGVDTITEVTDNHLYYNPKDDNYKQIGEFNIGDEVLSINGIGLIKSMNILIDENSSQEEQDTIVYNLHMKSGPSNYLVDGVVVHNEKQEPDEP